MELRTLASIAEIPSETWNALVPDGAPFLEHAWLSALETSGCVATTDDRGRDARERPRAFHLTLWDTSGPEKKLVAAAPAYLKTNSEGEFIFDHAIANAAPRLGVRYYPKLVLFVPFTPATGTRVLIAPEISGRGRDDLLRTFFQGVAEVTEELGLSSAHVLFPPSIESATAQSAGFRERFSVQYQFQNENFRDFEDFLSILPTKKRTQVRRERKQLEIDGVSVRTLGAEELAQTAVVDDLFRFYASTVDQFLWGRRYLNRAFFGTVAATFAHRLRPVVAERNGKRIAGALNVQGGDTLWGRYWGADEQLPFLHFNVCYYHGIEECIANKWRWFSPGAGGEHKRVRGFYPRITRSAHLFTNRGLDTAVDDFFARERESIEALLREEGRLRPDFPEDLYRQAGDAFAEDSAPTAASRTVASCT
jgi:hypothetical protein